MLKPISGYSKAMQNLAQKSQPIDMLTVVEEFEARKNWK